MPATIDRFLLRDSAPELPPVQAPLAELPEQVPPPEPAPRPGLEQLPPVAAVLLRFH